MSVRIWLYIKFLFGQHTGDMLSLGSNVMTDLDGNRLRHFTPVSPFMSDDVDAFAQIYSDQHKYYAFPHPPIPPFTLLPDFIYTSSFKTV